jgi:hypothetical protein
MKSRENLQRTHSVPVWSVMNVLATVAEDDKFYHAESVHKQSSLDRDLLDNQDNDTFNLQDSAS